MPGGRWSVRVAVSSEEQRQVVLDARRPAALADLPVDRTPRRIALEAPPPRTPERRHRIRGGRELPGREQIDALDPVPGALAVPGRRRAGSRPRRRAGRCAAARRRPSGKRSNNEPAYRVLPVLHHLADAGVSGPVQASAEGLDVEAVAVLDPEPVAVDEAARGDPSHRGGDRGHHDPRCERRQPRYGVQPLRDDVLVGREQIVGQGLPVREPQDRRPAVQIELQLAFEAMGALAVGGDDEHRRIGLPHQTGDRKATGAAVQRRPPRSRSGSGHAGCKRRDRHPISRPRRPGHASRPRRRPAAARAAVLRGGEPRSGRGSTC